MILINKANIFLNRIGAELRRYPAGDLNRRMKMLRFHDIDLVIDVGANKGEYGMELIKLGYNGEIVSFEPIGQLYQILIKEAQKYKTWKVFNTALGDFDGEYEINVAGNLNSSSLLEMLPAHENRAPESKYCRKEKIMVNRIDTILIIFINQTEIYL